MTSYPQRFLVGAALFLAIYYVVLAIYEQGQGFHTSEALFLTEKSLIVWQGIGEKIAVLGLTFPIFPFFFSLPFSALLPVAGPVISSSLGMALLFFLLLDDQRRRTMPLVIQVGTGLSFLVHPGLVFTAISGQSTYVVLLFGYLFFRGILTYFQSNTTYHVSMASLFLLRLVFSDVDFVWLCLFLLPLILFISLQSLSLRGDDTLLRLGLAFNNSSLRRKLINKSLALAILLFMLPLVSLFIFSWLNRLYAGDPQYFLDSPNANANVLTNQVFRLQSGNYTTNLAQSDVSLLIWLRRLIYAPLILLSLVSARSRTYQLLTLISPLLLVEFLHIKEPFLPLQIEFYQIFLMIGWAGLVIIPLPQLRRIRWLAFALMVWQIGSSSFRLLNSSDAVERSFLQNALPASSSQAAKASSDAPLIDFIRTLPAGSRVLTDDATAYPLIARTERIQTFLLPYQQDYLSALDNPHLFAQYVLVHNTQSDVKAYFSLTNTAYISTIQRRTGQPLSLIMKSSDWSIYALRAVGAAPQPQRSITSTMAGQTGPPE